MEVIRTKQFHIDEPTAVAMGKFDSLHLGHKVILDRLKREAECSLRTVVVAFDPGPEVFFGKYEGGFVLTAEEKKQLLEKAGIDYYILYPFDSETAGTEAEDFLEDVLIKQMNMQVLVAGEDVSFGKNGMVYNYLSNDNEITIGDKVKVLSRDGKNTITSNVVSVVKCKASNSPYPISKMKTILGKA